MELWQSVLVSLFGLMGLIGFIQATYQCRKCNNAFGHVTKVYVLQGSFVWADHVIFGFFWFLASFTALFFQDFLLFLLVFSLFWLVRAVGETIYWFFQQFSPRRGNEPEKFMWSWFEKNESVWFINQIFWQCVTVITIITSVYLFTRWLPQYYKSNPIR